MTVMAERLNYLRFISHFRAVHRGASFAGLRTTSVRKLLPEYALVPITWRFYCIVLFAFFSSFLHYLICSPLMYVSMVQILGIYVSCSHT